MRADFQKRLNKISGQAGQPFDLKQVRSERLARKKVKKGRKYVPYFWLALLVTWLVYLSGIAPFLYWPLLVFSTLMAIDFYMTKGKKLSLGDDDFEGESHTFGGGHSDGGGASGNW